MSRPRLSDRAAKYLEQALDGLLDGSRGLETIPREVAAIYFAGYEAGRDSLRPALARANADADYFYERWTTPDRDLEDVRQRRALQAVAEAADSGRPLPDHLIVELTVAAMAAPSRKAA